MMPNSTDGVKFVFTDVTDHWRQEIPPFAGLIKEFWFWHLWKIDLGDNDMAG